MADDLVTHRAPPHRVLTDDLREQASLYSLGLLESILDADAAVRWKQHLEHCGVCTAEVRACLEVATLASIEAAERVMATLPAGEPPARVKENLLRKIAALETQADNSAIRRAGQGRWHKLLPGIEIKRLFVDTATGAVTSLVRVAAGAVYPAHLHKGIEHLYVLDGDIVFDDHTLSSGDYEVRPANSRHSSATTLSAAPNEGCLLLVINSGHDEFVD